MNYEVAQECTYLSDKEQITFPEAVRRLYEAGIESYYADLLMENKTFYEGNEAFVVESKDKSSKTIAKIFNGEKVQQAIRQIQTGKIKYQKFLHEIMDAGVISYSVFIHGKKAIYFGRNGEMHIEEFPKSG